MKHIQKEVSHSRETQHPAEDTRKPSTTYANAEENAPQDARAQQLADSPSKHEKVAKDVEIALNQIDAMIAAMSDMAIQAA